MAFYQMLSDRVYSAAQRSRIILLISVVVCLAQIGAAYNFSLSFLRSFTKGLVMGSTEDKDAGVLSKLQEKVMSQWVDQLEVDVSLIGLSFSVVDTSVIGAFSLLIVSTWLYYSCRRENHLIGNMICSATMEGRDVKRFVFQSACSSQMFTTLSDTNSPISSMHPSYSYSIGRISGVVKILIFFPVVTVLITFAVDMASLFCMTAFFRGSERTFIIIF